MKTSEVITGLQTLKPHYKDEDGYHVGADHDTIYAYQTDTPLSPDEVATMLENHWFQLDHEGMNERDMEPGDYRPDENWTAYV